MRVDRYFDEFARKICEYAMKNYILPYFREHGVVQSYRAKVVSVDSGAGTMLIERPYDSQITLPYSASAAGLQAGDECVVFSLGDPLNSIVVSDGKLSTI